MLNMKMLDLINGEDDLIDKSTILVSELFKDKKDKDGKPYMEHLYYVTKQQCDYIGKVVGLLHDVVEDTYVDINILKGLGYPKEILEAVQLLTRDKSVSYQDYIDNILLSGNLVALRVKKADMEHNMDKDRMQHLDEATKIRLTKKYKNQFIKINRKLEEIENDRY